MKQWQVDGDPSEVHVQETVALKGRQGFSWRSSQATAAWAALGSEGQRENPRLAARPTQRKAFFIRSKPPGSRRGPYEGKGASEGAGKDRDLPRKVGDLRRK